MQSLKIFGFKDNFYVFGHVTQGKNKIPNQVLQLPVYESDNKKDISIYTTFLIHICVKKWGNS